MRFLVCIPVVVVPEDKGWDSAVRFQSLVGVDACSYQEALSVLEGRLRKLLGDPVPPSQEDGSPQPESPPC